LFNWPVFLIFGLKKSENFSLSGSSYGHT